MDEPALQVECPHCGAVFNVADGPVGPAGHVPRLPGGGAVLDVQEEELPWNEAKAEQEHENEHRPD